MADLSEYLSVILYETFQLLHYFINNEIITTIITDSRGKAIPVTGREGP
jgi:hypothetical protein